MSPANTVLRLESTVNNEDATDNQQTVANQEATALQGAVSSQVSVASQMAIASENAVACQATATDLSLRSPESVEHRTAPRTRENRIKPRSTSQHQSELENLEPAANTGVALTLL
ncbi:hypothetical protein PC129_g12499 [Phytophthora cactorum]|nr:hypothetical protein PC119_g14513 [Phytophthora cactorum]KAG3216639.1 hypothetical protein PC129_g12499 [Phytophthora cactorum]KAG4041235.1 hypothetical protein PC123_g23241 [Phytophthora cactorum]